MRILEVCRYKENFIGHMAPFVKEQGEAIRDYLNRGLVNGNCKLVNEPSAVEYFLVKGNYLKAVKPLKEKIREFRPDIIHAHFGLSAIPCVLQKEVPVVITFHDGETHFWHVNLLSSLCALRAKHVIYVAPHVRELSYFKARNYSIIPCGVPMEEMVITEKAEARQRLGWSNDTKYILFGGAFNNLRKNYAILRDAVQQLQNSNFKFQIEIVEMRGLKREQCVLRMCAADLFALPSHREGSPQALKEAMAVNCPCLATDIADVRILFGDESGHWILRNPKNRLWKWEEDEKSLDEMVELLKEALRFEGRTNGRKRILDLGLSNEQVAKRIVEIYNQVL